MLLGVKSGYHCTAFDADASRDRKRHPVIMLLDLVELFYQKQKVGLSVSESEALEVLGRDEMGCASAGRAMSNYLKTKFDYAVQIPITLYSARNLAQIDFWTFYSQLPYPLPHRKDIGNIHADDEWMEKLAQL